jgi:hypothetical protein
MESCHRYLRYNYTPRSACMGTIMAPLSSFCSTTRVSWLLALKVSIWRLEEGLPYGISSTMDALLNNMATELICEAGMMT